MMATAPVPRSMLDYALSYVRGPGWAVLPLHWITQSGRCSCGNAECRSPGKHPYARIAPHGVQDATKDEAVIRGWWGQYPELNIGIATGAISGIAVIDIDPRNGGDESWKKACELNEYRDADTVTQVTGGGGRHYVFQYAADRAMKKLGPGIDYKTNGGYILAEPSNHISGKRYGWYAESDPLEGATPAALPDWVSDPKKARAVHLPWQKDSPRKAVGVITPAQGKEIIAALKYLDADSRDVWIAVGMALHSTSADDAFEYWDDWSQSSPKYDQADSVRVWRSFADDRHDGLHIESLFQWAYDAGWPGPEREAKAIEDVRILQATPKEDVPDDLLRVPGALQACVAYHNASAPRPQPELAVACALALGSVACARKFRRNPGNNWTPLYFVTVALSSAGKEHSRTVIDQALSAAEWPEIMGRSNYTSDAGVISALLYQPAHISIIDEIGAVLANAKSDAAYQARSAVTSMVEAWGACHGTIRPKAYSTMTLAADQAAEMMKKVVYNPGLCLLGMTTPSDFYGAMTEQSIKGGFLSRLLVVEGQGRQLARDVEPFEVPDTLVQWLRDVRARTGAEGNLASMPPSAGQRPTPIDIPTDLGAKHLFREYEAETLARMDELDEYGLAELEGRSVEKAMRIATILAVSCCTQEPRVTEGLAQWAVDYVRHHTKRLIQQVQANVHLGRFSEWQATIFRAVAKAGAKGMTERELCKKSRAFDALDMRQRRQVMDALVMAGKVDLVVLETAANRGRKRQAWVAIEEDAA